MERIHGIRSQMRTFVWVDQEGVRHETRANGVGIVSGALVFQDVDGESILAIGPRAWLSVSPK